MADPQLPSPNENADALTFLEKLVDVRLLVLVLAFLFYMDIWVLHTHIDPTTLTLEQFNKHLQTAPIFKIATFFLSFSILAGAFFPAIRQIYGLLWINFSSSKNFVREGRSNAARRLSDWSLALVVLSLHDFAVGFFSTENYRGLAWYLVQIFESNALEPTVFRVTSIIFLLVCFVLALEIDV